MLKLIYGSSAIAHWFPEYLEEVRKPADLDYISEEGRFFNKNEKTEGHWCNAFNWLKENNKDDTYVDVDNLYTIKLSHLSYDINWTKHMKDVVFLKKKGAKLVQEFYDLLMESWKEVHGKKRISLSGKNEDFFKKNIYRAFDHDWLHEEYALHGRPMNERIRKDLSSPKCYKELWDKLTHQEKMDCCIEETYVLTTERFLFVEGGNIHRLKSYKFNILKNMCVSTTGGWFNQFIKENFEELLDYSPKYILEKIEKINENYLEKHQAK